MAFFGRPAEQQQNDQPEPLDTPPSLDLAGPALLIETGSVMTRVALLDVVEGQQRFVASGSARTTVGGSNGDITVGIRGAITQVEYTAGRRLIDSTGVIYPERSDGSGQNVTLMTAGFPLHIAFIGMADTPALAAARSDLVGAAVVTVDSMWVPELLRAGRSMLERVNDLLAKSPEAIVVVGSHNSDADPRAEQVAGTLAAAIASPVSERPSVVFVGNPDQAKHFRSALDEIADLRVIEMLPSALESVSIRDELRQVWLDRLGRHSPGYSVAQSWTNTSMLPTSEGFATALRFLAMRRGSRVVGVDVGSTTAALVVANADDAVIHIAKIGIGRETAWATSDPAVFSRLLPSMEPDRLQDAVRNRSVRPWSIPETTEEQALNRGLIREAVRELIRQAGPVDVRWRKCVGLAVARGGDLGTARYPDEIARALVDGLGAFGIYELSVDHYGILPGLGGLAGVMPQPAAEVLLTDGIAPLATVIAMEGDSKAGAIALRVEVRRPNGNEERHDLMTGQVVGIPLDTREVAEVSVIPSSGLDVGWGKGTRVTLRLRGGPAGLIVDARSRQPNQPKRNPPKLDPRFARMLISE